MCCFTTAVLDPDLPFKKPFLGTKISHKGDTKSLARCGQQHKYYNIFFYTFFFVPKGLEARFVFSFIHIFTTNAHQPRPQGFLMGLILTICSFLICVLFSYPFWLKLDKKEGIFKVGKQVSNIITHTRRNGPLCGFCPSDQAFLSLWAIKGLIMLFWPIVCVQQ